MRPSLLHRSLQLRQTWKRRIAGHIRGMINQTKTTVIFACPQCNLAHEVTQTHSHTKKAGGFDCAECGAAVHFWYGCFVYSDWRAVNMNSMNFTHPDALGAGAPVSADELRRLKGFRGWQRRP
jgi:transcription elongation factor Elf1